LILREHAVVVKNPDRLFAHQAARFYIEVYRIELEVARSMFRNNPINVND